MLTADDTASHLVRHHATTRGTYVWNKGDHANFRYTFVVNGLQYQSYGSSSEHNLNDIEAGQPFEVYYDPANPNINSVSEPNRDSALGKEFVTFFSLLLVGVLAIVTRKLGAIMRASAVATASMPSNG